MNAKPKYLENYSEDLRRRMQSIRMELPGDMQQVRTEVNNLTDWKYYVRTYPHYVLPVVAVAAYAMVPKSHHASSSHSHHLSPSAREEKEKQERDEEVQQSSMLAGLTSAALTMATRSLLTVATRYGTQYLTQRFGNGDSFMSSGGSAGSPRPSASQSTQSTYSREG